MTSTLITKAAFKRMQRNVALAYADKVKCRREALKAIADIRLATPGKRRLCREDVCASYMDARHMLASARGQLVNIKILEG